MTYTPPEVQPGAETCTVAEAEAAINSMVGVQLFTRQTGDPWPNEGEYNAAFSAAYKASNASPACIKATAIGFTDPINFNGYIKLDDGSVFVIIGQMDQKGNVVISV